MMADIQWQNSTSFADTNAYMLDHEILCDVTLLAGETKEAVKCHKFMLASRSPVFHAMFCGALTETTDTIEIPDINIETLNAIVSFMYTATIEITGDNVMPLLYASRKYNIVRLGNECAKFLHGQITPDNVCSIFEQSFLLDDRNLQEKCLGVIRDNTSEVLESDEFVDLSKIALDAILGLDGMTCVEADVYRACKRWAVNKCLGIEEDCQDPTNIRRTLGSLMLKIRFPTMGAGDFCKNVASDDILTEQEKNDVYQDILQGKTMSGFNVKPRLGKRYHIKRCRSVSTEEKWCYSDKTDAIRFSISSPAYLLGVMLYLPTVDNGVCEGSLSIFENDKHILTQKVLLRYSPNDQHNHVYFEKNITLQLFKMYSLRLKMTGAATYRGIDGITSALVADNVNIRFQNDVNSTNGTCVTRGQFCGLTLTLRTT